MLVFGTDHRGMSVCAGVAPGRVNREVGTLSAVLLPYAPASVATARWQLAADLREAGIAETAIGDAALVMSELLSNAIRHARPLPGACVRVAWELTGDSLEVSVEDGGATTRPRASHPSLSSLGGRGLAIVEHLSTNWGVKTSDGTTVWAILEVPGPTPTPATAAARGG